MPTKFNMVGIFVQDIHRMVDFYHNVLGIDIEWDEQGPYAEFKHEGIRFSMYERKMLPGLLGKTPDYPTDMNGTFELSINVGDPKEVDRVYTRIIDGGGKVVYMPRDEPWKMRSAMIADPEGNLIEIASDFWE